LGHCQWLVIFVQIVSVQSLDSFITALVYIPIIFF
jgi:hypothetical protein